MGHGCGVLRTGDGGVHQHRFHTHLHRHRRIRGGPDSRIHDDRYVHGFHNNANGVRVADTQPGANGCAQRHDYCRAGIFELFGHDRIIRGVGHDHKALFDQHLGGFEQLFRIGVERLFIADDFKLDEIRQPRFPSQLGG